MKHTALFASSLGLFVCLPGLATGESMTGEGPNLAPRITQHQVENELNFNQIRKSGERVFATPFNKQDGYGDGPYNPSEGDPREFGNRPSLQNGIPNNRFDGRNGTFLRVNGLDGQTCLECHFITRNSTIPATLGVGGAAAGANQVLFMPSDIDVADLEPGEFNGRFINPPFLFGSGGVELLAKEMTMELQKIKADALANPGFRQNLTAKGVDFGTIVADNLGNLDTSAVEGVDEDLVIRPFGRKGEFATVRAFDIGAMQFHFGIQANEEICGNVVDDICHVDADGDGVTDELKIGELSALHIFGTTLERPIVDADGDGLEEPLTLEAQDGFKTFKSIGCADCHRPFLTTDKKRLSYSFPEEETDPEANVYRRINLVKKANFEKDSGGSGIVVSLLSDLKRHRIGNTLRESFDVVNNRANRAFITARLWGVRDTAPYLHDGRATTITEAILMHGGEAKAARNSFRRLRKEDKDKVIAFLFSLRTPVPVQ